MRHLDLIAGLPYEDYDSFGRSFDEIYELKPNQLWFGFLRYSRARTCLSMPRNMVLCTMTSHRMRLCPQNGFRLMNAIKIKRVEEMLEVYYNSGQFEITMKLMECIFDSAFRVFSGAWRFL